jgi:phosphoglycolate phosphatase
MKYNTFIFDFDYTLVDATIGIVSSFNYALHQLGIAHKSEESIKRTVGIPLRDAFSMLTGNSNKHIIDQFASHFMDKADIEMTANTVLFEDTLDVLTQLKKMHCNTAVVTSKNHFRIDDVVEKFNMHGLIDYIVGVEDVVTPKPSPEGLLMAIDHFGVAKQSVLFIGDTVIDAETAANASVDFAAVLTGTTTAKAFESLPNIYLADSLTDLFNRIIP